MADLTLTTSTTIAELIADTGADLDTSEIDFTTLAFLAEHACGRAIEISTTPIGRQHARAWLRGAIALAKLALDDLDETPPKKCECCYSAAERGEGAKTA